ncbi:hypothetical protein B0T19DRAFT_422710 [Cercophora scortea]|uniref:Uncharacterized protein n=1 Tax=Cercophora scortea TaxID=314031 RepID=A0AAE0IMG8_9PEZI|nr:hypothetical protein B0T19DRAFT_422710 [Cercophora scortea]
MAQQPPRQPLTSNHLKISNPDDRYEYATSIPCNKMTYKDGSGVAHEIFLPAGSAKAAADHYANKRWDELAKFPKWQNQPYTDEFYVITKFKKAGGGNHPDGDDEDEGVVVKEAGEALVLNEQGEVVLPSRDDGDGEGAK